MLKFTMLVACSAAAICGLTALTAAQTTAYEGVRLLDQNWSPDERVEYYYTSQGSAALRYEIFISLEQPGGETLFRTDENLARFGLVFSTTRPEIQSRRTAAGDRQGCCQEGPLER